MEALITGGTAGIGYGVARQLAAKGWNVTIVGRNPQRGAQIAREIKGRFIQANLSLMSEVTRLAEHMTKPLDALILSAGIVFPRADDPFTEEGLEVTFATNYLGRYVLSQMLLPQLASTNGCLAMISGSGSGRYGMVTTDWDVPQSGIKAARRAALAVDMYAAYLAQSEPHIRVHTCYPGIVRTNIMRNAPLPMRLFVRWFGSSIEQGSAWVTRLVTENHAGVHWEKDKPLRFSPPLPTDYQHLLDYSQRILTDTLLVGSNALQQVG